MTTGSRQPTPDAEDPPPARRAARDPSSWHERLALAVLALAGAAVSVYLALFELGVLASVWDPVFGARASRAVLHSSLSKALPVPDALLGALNYGVETILDLIGGGAERWRRRPLLVLAFGVPVAAGVIASIGLVLVQAFVVGRFCALCLVSAGLSIAIGALASREVLAALGVWRAGR